MIYDDEKLPLYIRNKKNNIQKNSHIKSQNPTSSKKQINKTINAKMVLNGKELPDNKKLINETATNGLIIAIYNFINILFNNKNKKIILFFFILILVAYIEFFIDKFIDIFALKFAIFILFSIPYLIIILDNESFFQLNSDFELNFLVFMKLIVLFNKKMNFFEIILISINANLFQSIFIKKIHMKQYFYSLDGYIDKINYKIYIFESEFYFIICSFVITIISLGYLLKNEKFSFYLFDEILNGLGQNYNYAYFFLFEFFLLRKFIKYIIKYISFNDNNKYKNRDKSKIIYISFYIFIVFQIILINVLYNSFGEKISNTFFILLIIFIYENIGIILFLSLILLSIIIFLGNNYMESHFSNDIINLFNSNIKYIHLSFLLSLVFIISIFILEKKQISNFYIKIYQRIFLIKIIFDIWLIIKYIYSLYKYNHINYFNIFINTYKLFFSFFVLNYLFVLILVLIKLYIYIKPNDVDYCFEEILIFLNNKKLKKEVFYGGDSPYFEIKLYKKCKKLSSFLQEDISKSNKKMKAFQKILYSIIVFILIFLALIINNNVIYFPVFFVLLQLCSDFLNDIVFLILNKFSILIYLLKENDENFPYKKYKEDYMIQKYNKKIMKQRAKANIIQIKKEKFKMVYILSYFHIYLFIKKIFSRFYIFIYENFISIILYKIFGKLEPLSNIIYQFIFMNFYQEKFNKNIVKENIFLFLFLLPNSLAIIHSHYTNKKLNFFFQNYILTSLLPYFFKLDFAITFLGFLNVFLMINLFVADNTTYKDYKFWFFLFGIQSMNFQF